MTETAKPTNEQIVRSDLGDKHASMNRTHPIELLDHPIPGVVA